MPLSVLVHNWCALSSTAVFQKKANHLCCVTLKQGALFILSKAVSLLFKVLLLQSLSTLAELWSAVRAAGKLLSQTPSAPLSPFFPSSGLFFPTHLEPSLLSKSSRQMQKRINHETECLIHLLFIRVSFSDCST